MVKMTKEKVAPLTSGDISNSGMALFQFVERYERLQEEKEGITDDQKEVMSEAKATGFDTKIIRRLIAIRKMDAGDYEEGEDLLEIYMRAVKAAEKHQVAQSVADGE
jgi:uncharacterized protein (UPF0335 family)